MKKLNLVLLLSLFAASYGLCQGKRMENAQKAEKATEVLEANTKINKAVCMLYPTKGNTAIGTITFIKMDGTIKISADLKGLSKGKHGIHIHECGDCSASDGSSAGGHFNPISNEHGSPTDKMRHMGDMGNIEADESGNAHLEYTDEFMKLEGPTSIIGRAVIVHASEDDLKTQPTGNSGARIACGVIGISK